MITMKDESDKNLNEICALKTESVSNDPKDIFIKEELLEDKINNSTTLDISATDAETSDHSTANAAVCVETELNRHPVVTEEKHKVEQTAASLKDSECGAVNAKENKSNDSCDGNVDTSSDKQIICPSQLKDNKVEENSPTETSSISKQDEADAVPKKEVPCLNQLNAGNEWEKKEAEFPDEHAEKLMEQKDGQILCKLCPPGNNFDQVQFRRHLSDVHFQDKITVESKWLCLPCFKPCQNLPSHHLHYHCPVCRQPVCHKQTFIDHIKEHKGILKNSCPSRNEKEISGNKENSHQRSRLKKRHISEVKEVKTEDGENSSALSKSEVTAQKSINDNEKVEEMKLNSFTSKPAEYKIERIRKYWALVNGLDISRIIQSLTYSSQIDKVTYKHCLLCPESVHFSSQQEAEEHLYLIHAIYFIVVQDKWACLPCCKACNPCNQDMHYHCPICKQLFLRQSCFLGHMKLQHQEDPVYLKDVEKYLEGLIEETVGLKGRSRTLEEVGRSPFLSFQINSDTGDKDEKENFDACHYLKKYAIAPCFIKLEKLEKVASDNSTNRLTSPLNFASETIEDSGILFDQLLHVVEDSCHCKYCDFETNIQKWTDAQEHVLTEHWEERVSIHDLDFAFPCMKSCGAINSTHYHCPLCKLTVFGDRESFLKHVQRHPNPSFFKGEINHVDQNTDYEEKTIMEPYSTNGLPCAHDKSAEEGTTTYDDKTESLETDFDLKEKTFTEGLPSLVKLAVNNEAGDLSTENCKEITSIEKETKFQQLISVIKLEDLRRDPAELFYMCVEQTAQQYRCKLCPFSVDLEMKSMILNHLKMYHQAEVALVDQKWICLPFKKSAEEQESYCCPICNEAVMRKNAFLLHTISHKVTISFDVVSLTENALQQSFPISSTRDSVTATASDPVSKAVNSKLTGESACSVTDCQHTDKNHYHCTQCGELFFKKQLYVRHMQEHRSSVISRPPENDTLRKSGRLETTIDGSHKLLSNQTDDADEGITSPTTRKKRSRRETSLKDKSDIPSKRTSVCPESGEKNSVYRLKREQVMKLIIRSGKQFRCALCADGGYTFKRSDPVIQHLVNVHVKKGVLVNNKLVVPCLKNCYVELMKNKNERWLGERIHYHCITCKLVVTGKVKFLDHALSHAASHDKNCSEVSANGTNDSNDISCHVYKMENSNVSM